MDDNADLFYTRTHGPIFTSRRRRRRRRWPWAVALAVLLIGAGAWYLARWRDSSMVIPRTAEITDPVEPAPAQPEADLPSTLPSDLPPLGASDELLRRFAPALSANPTVAEWLASDALIRRFVVSVVGLAQGRSPRARLEFMAPGQELGVYGEGRRLVLDPASYRRYDDVTAAFASLHAEGIAELYHRLRPLFHQAYRELGLRGFSFEDQLARAFGHVLAFEPPGQPVELLDGGGIYEFADPRLELATPAAKHLIRMGPDNARRVQEKVTEIAAAMGIDPREPPH